jgi:poly(A) polymerase
MDPQVIEAIAEHRRLITKASPARLMEEYFKILRSGYAETTFRALDRVRLLELVTPELAAAPDPVWDSLARLDLYRAKHAAAPADLTTTVLIGALLVPLGVLRRPAALRDAGDFREERLSFGMLPVPRRDLERLRQLMQTVPRLADPALPPRVARGLPHRPAFADSVTWLDIFGDAPDLVERWRHVRAAREHHDESHRHGHGLRPDSRRSPRTEEPEGIPEGGTPLGGAPEDGAAHTPHAPRRRRRRRRRRRGGNRV